MKKFLSALLALSLLAGCSTTTTDDTAAADDTAEETANEASEAAEAASGAYTIVNNTGEKVTELYIYVTGTDDKGTNEAGGGLDVEGTVEITREGTSDEALTLSYTTESGRTSEFTTLSYEEATISLLAESDFESGATPISFVTE